MLLKKLKRTTDSQRTAFLAALVLVGVIAVYNWIVAPHRNYLLAAQRYDSAVNSLVKKNQTISNNLIVKKKKLKELQEKLNNRLEMFFGPLEAKEFFSSIKAVTDKSGCIMYSLTLSSVDPLSGSSRQGTDNFIIARTARLDVLGGYCDIEALMNKLQQRTKYVQIDSVKISSDNDNPGYLKCEMAITIYEIQRKENRRHG